MSATPSDPRVPELIAHRGFAAAYPENTRLALRAALELGARCIEFDVQLTADGVPVLMHDADLSRTTGTSGNLLDMSLRELIGIRVREPARFGDAFNEPVPLLEDIMRLLPSYPGVKAFVEIKRASLRRFGIPFVLERVMPCLETAAGQCAVISFEYHAVQQARQLGARSIGWVIDAWHDRIRDAAAKLAPEFLFVDHQLLPAPPQPLWDGPWRWAAYEVADPELALALGARGIDFVETMAIGPMLENERLRGHAAVVR